MELPRAADVFRALGGVPAREGYLCRCPVPGHGRGRGDRRPSLSVRDGERQLLFHCFAGCSPDEIKAALGACDLTNAARTPAVATRPVTEPKTTTADALRLWRASLSSLGTPVEDYLASRRLPADLSTVRFLPRFQLRSKMYRAKIAALQAPDRKIVSVQLTLLHPSKPRKAELLRPRRIIGPSRGFALRLAPAAETLGLAEGYETGHAAMRRYGVPVWCSLGSGRLPLVAIPDVVRRIVVFADPDPAGRRAAEQVVAAHPGLDVTICEPPVAGPDDDRDFADFWQSDPSPQPLA